MARASLLLGLVLACALVTAARAQGGPEQAPIQELPAFRCDGRPLGRAEYPIRGGRGANRSPLAPAPRRGRHGRPAPPPPALPPSARRPPWIDQCIRLPPLLVQHSPAVRPLQCFHHTQRRQHAAVRPAGARAAGARPQPPGRAAVAAAAAAAACRPISRRPPADSCSPGCPPSLFFCIVSRHGLPTRVAGSACATTTPPHSLLPLPLCSAAPQVDAELPVAQAILWTVTENGTLQLEAQPFTTQQPIKVGGPSVAAQGPLLLPLKLFQAGKIDGSHAPAHPLIGSYPRLPTHPPTHPHAHPPTLQPAYPSSQVAVYLPPAELAELDLYGMLADTYVGPGWSHNQSVNQSVTSRLPRLLCMVLSCTA